MGAVDPQAGQVQPDFVGALLVADTRAFVEAWRGWIDAKPSPDALAELRERSKTLQIRARGAEVGGLAHHLAACDECLEGGTWEPAQLEEKLRNVLELAWQFEQDLELRRAQPPAQPPPLESVSNPASELVSEAGPASVPPPPMLSVAWPGWKRRSSPPEPAPREPAAASEPATAAPEPAPNAVLAAPAEPAPSVPVSSLSAAALTSEPADPVREGAEALSQILGLVPLSPRHGSGSESVVAGGAKPPRLDVDTSGLPLLEAEPEGEEDLTDRDLEIRLERVRRAAPYPLLQREIAIDLPPESAAHFRRRFIRKRRPWWVAPVMVGVLGAAAALVLTLGGSRQAQTGVPAGSLATITRGEALLPLPRLTEERESLRALLSQVHAHGGIESPELAAVLDEEAAVLAKALAEPCTPGTVACRLSEQSREILAQPPVQKSVPPSVPALADWLSGLSLPQIGLEDDPRVRKIVEYHTKDPAGREIFQGLLFRCAPYQELFREGLMQQGLPVDLIAVVMVESACVTDAESPVGARGLWQFMPATARAYHLRVQSGVIDERLSVTKSTDAALEFLSDLNRKLRSWELALASYNMGPFGLLARMERAGGDVDYWDLVNAGRLPAETAAYVPKIEAFALILANLAHFRFDSVQQRVEPSSTPLLAPAGTRLGMVARAAGSSTSRIRELNPELLAETVPGTIGQEFELRVPSEAPPQAREFLQRLIAQADDADECVPSGFDWGRQQFTRAMLSRCSSRGLTRSVAGGLQQTPTSSK